MSIKDKYHVQSIDKYETKEWILKKHYAHRMPSVSYAFGLYRQGEWHGILEGICTFGISANPHISYGVCGEQYRDIVIELNRLVINPLDVVYNEKNHGSYFVSHCLKQLPQPLIVISYSDVGQGHHGYIYQSTNFLFTGTSKERTDIYSDGHSRHYDKTRDYSVDRQIRTAKNRYIYFLGTKKEKREMRQALKYPVLPYPKGDNKRYDASYQPDVQLTLY